MPDGEDPTGSGLVGEQFWLARGREMVVEASARRDDAARALLRALTSLWTVYVAAALVVSAWITPPLGLGLLLALPALVLAAAFAMALAATLPTLVTFDPARATDIELAWWRAATVKKRRLLWAQSLTAAAAVTLAGAILGLVAL